MEKIIVFWFRRDLRLDDNTGLNFALNSGLPVLPVFIFDPHILEKLEDRSDKRVAFILEQIQQLKSSLEKFHSSLWIKYGNPKDVFADLTENFTIEKVIANHDYEPYAIKRDQEISLFLSSKNIDFQTYKDQVIFEKNEVVKDDGTPYTVFTPYSRKWLSKFQTLEFSFKDADWGSFIKTAAFDGIEASSMGFAFHGFEYPENEIPAGIIQNYDQTRNFPGQEGTSRLGVHLRFGTISIRKLASFAKEVNSTFLNELIWREFFMQILYHFPEVEFQSFKKPYDRIEWKNDVHEFEKWCRGETGYPLVDAGMRELNETGFMHNRVRMVTASFLTKHLLIDWRWGEAYFASKLLDYELSANNGNWQWAAGTGCDAAPYFRIFNPIEQLKKFDPELRYVKKWVPEFQTFTYAKPIVDHQFARNRCLAAYKKALSI